MFHLKHILITPIIKIPQYIQLFILTIVFVSVNLRAQDVTVAEVTVKEYSFMSELANLINSTSEITNRRIKTQGDYLYKLDIHPRNYTSNEIVSSLLFNPKGSYSIHVEYINELSVAIPYEYIFHVNNIKFVSCQDLTPYYTSCNRKRQVLSFKGYIITSGIYWYISIKDGKVEKAFFLDSEYDDPAYNTVYDLISGETMLETEYIDRYN